MDNDLIRARKMIRALLENFADDGDDRVTEDLREDLCADDDFYEYDEWEDYEVDYDAVDSAVERAEARAQELARTMLKEMRNW